MLDARATTSTASISDVVRIEAAKIRYLVTFVFSFRRLRGIEPPLNSRLRTTVQRLANRYEPI